MKKRLSIFIVMLCAMFTTVMAESFKYTYRGVTFYVHAKGSRVTITGFDENISEVRIPAEVKGKNGNTYQVTGISFFDETSMYKTRVVIIEKGIKDVEDYCFRDFRQLQVLYVPSSIERFGKNTFNKKQFPEIKMSKDMATRVRMDDLKNGLVVSTMSTADATNTEDDFAGINLEDYGMSNPNSDIDGEGENVTTAAVVGIAAGTSDVDYDIPRTGEHRENTYCVIIANEDYQKAPKVNYARVDGETFYKYCTSTLGIPGENVHKLSNAKYLQMNNELEWLINLSAVSGDEAKFIVYYAGHGIAGEDGTCYMLPVDGDPNNSTNGFSLKKLNQDLERMTQSNANALVLMDACFSGSDRSDGFIISGDKRGMVKDVKVEEVTGNVVFMSATTDTQTALSDDSRGHGMFTYYLLKKLKETKGNVTYGDLFDYVKKNVSKRSVVMKNKPQTPSFNVSNAMYNKWRSMKF